MNFTQRTLQGHGGLGGVVYYGNSDGKGGIHETATLLILFGLGVIMTAVIMWSLYKYIWWRRDQYDRIEFTDVSLCSSAPL